jgi:drug/metabolite transporter (DMT)-like permease
MRNGDRFRVWASFIIASTVWGSTWIAIRLGLESVPPLLAISARFALASAILGLIVWIRRLPIPRTRDARIVYLSMGFLTFAIPFALVYWGQQFIPSALGSIIFAAFPFWVALFSHWMTRDRLDAYKVAGIVLGFFGVLIVFQADVALGSREGLLGMLAIAVSVVIQAFSLVQVKKHGEEVDPMVLNFVGMLIGMASLLLLSLVLESGRPVRWTAQAVFSVAYLALVGSILAFVAYYWLLKRVHVVYLSMTSFINPIVAVLLGALVLGERLAPSVFLGALLVLAGVFVANWKSFAQKLRGAPLLVLLALLGHDAPAQLLAEPPGAFEKRPAPDRRPEPRTGWVGTPLFDLLHYRIHLDLPLARADLAGRSEMTVRLNAPLDSIRLHGAKLEIDSAAVEGVAVPFRLDEPGESVVFGLGGTRRAGDTVLLNVHYRRVPGVARPAGRDGYYWYTPALSPYALDTLGYTMSEPSDARFWLVCHDDPSDKATAEISVTVPRGFVAASNGKLVAVVSLPGGRQRWEWKEESPIASYLLCVTASKFTISTLPFARAAGDTVPLQYYVWAPDSAACAAYLPTVGQMVQHLSALFVPYPFAKYGMTAVSPFGFGGMEHQSLTTLHRAYKTSRRLVVHELAHQWWGDLVTCGTWADIWLNESFATYAEALWEESLGGPPALRSTMAGKLSFDASWNSALYDPLGQGQDLFADLVYSKGAWVLHTLRGMIGDSAFFRSLRDYLASYRMRSAVTSDLQAVVERNCGMRLGHFFDAWVYGEGYPVYAFSWAHFGDSLSVRVFQQQSSSWPTYAMPLPFRAFGEGGDTTFVLRDSLRVQSFRVPFPWAPDSVKLDPDGWILKKTAPPPLHIASSGDGPLAFRLDQNYPNPFNPATVIGFELPRPGPVKLVVYDLLGRRVATLLEGARAAGHHEVLFDASGLPSGVYLCRLAAEGSSAVRKMIVAR